MDSVLRKTYRATVKEVNADEGILDLMIPISTGQVDRDGEVIEPTAFKKTIPKFMKHPVLVAAHDYRDLTNQIGEWTKLKVEDDGVSGKPKYYINAGNPEADWAYYLASKGVAAFSVGFIPKVWEDGDGEKAPRRTYKEVELLEISQVIIPSNREAIQSMRSKSVDDPVITELCDEVEKTIEEKEVITKPEETDEFIRIPVRTCEVTATIDISKKEGISALYCGKEKKVRTYLFRKDKGWTMEKAKAWVKEHEGKEFNPSEEEGVIIKEDNPKQKKDVSQAEIRDELDYLDNLITQSGLSKETAFDAVDIAIRTMARAWQYHQWESITLGENLTGQKEPIIFKRELVKSVWGESVKMDMGKMQEMHDMISSCEIMAKKSKKMVEDMMSEDEDHEDIGERNPGSDIPVNKNNKADDLNVDILREIQTTKLGGK